MKAPSGIGMLLPLMLTCLMALAQQSHDRCGIWRWNVKTLTDKGGIDLLTKKPIHTTIDQLIKIKPPKILHAISHADGLLPRYSREKQVVEIFAWVTEIKSEEDHDLHFVLKSRTTDSTMVGEIPDPACPDYDSLPALRAYFEKTRENGMNVRDSLKKTKKPVKVKITGVPFWDGAHSNRPVGASRYFREIHPILTIEIQ
jgi:hypothetical protein